MFGLLEPSPTMLTTAQLGLLVLLSLTVGSSVAWLIVLSRRSQGRTTFPAPSTAEAPWGLSDLFIVAAIWLTSMFATALIADRALGLAANTPAAADRESAPSAELESTGDASDRSPPAAPLHAGLFFVSAVCSLLACVASLAYLHLRFGPKAWRFLGLRDWKRQLGFGLLGFLLAMPPVIWLMSLLIRFLKYEHMTLDALAGSPTPAVIAATWFSAGLVAPLTEEFFFRYVLQSWLFRVRLRDNPIHRWNVLYGDPPTRAAEPIAEPAQDLGPRTLLPIVCSSLCFAFMHAGQGPAPIALFVYALALGYVYHRTGSLIPCIVMHMLLNVYSLTLATLAALEAQGAVS